MSLMHYLGDACTADTCKGQRCEHCAAIEHQVRPALPAHGTVARTTLDNLVMKQHQTRKARIDDDGR